MFKRWFCLVLALVMAWASLSLAEEIAVPNDAVVLEEGEDELIIEELPEDIELDPLEDLDLDLSQTGDLLDEAQPADEATPGAGSVDASNEAEPCLSLSATKLVIGVKEKCTALTVTRIPEDSTDTITWSSSKTSVAKVDKKTGKITGVKKGTAVITARSASGLKADCTVTVKKAPGKVTLTPTELTLSVGEKGALTAKLPSGTGSTLTFSSASRKIAKVDKLTGTVTAVATGSTKITVKTFNGKKATCKVTVVAAPSEVFLPETVTVVLNEKTTVEATAVDADGNQVPATFKYSAEAGTGRVSISTKTGKIKGKALGTATIRVKTHNGVSTHLSGGMAVDTVCQVNVVATTDRVELAAGKLSLGVDQSYDLAPRVVTADGAAVEGATYTASSSDDSVVSVSDTGVVKGLRTGSATVTVTSSTGAVATCDITVVDAASLLTVSPASVSGNPGEGAQLSWSIGSEKSPASVTFASGNTSVASVSASGYITFVAPGATKVTARAADGQEATVNVTVREDADGDVSYRLFAAYSYYDSLPFVKRNANGMATVFKKSGIGGQTYATKVMGNPSKSKLLSGISSFFKAADGNDVSIVYLCSHGHNNSSSYSSYRLSLMGYDKDKSDTNYYLTSKEIFSSVQAISGNVILILDSCYSGTFINDMKSRLNGEDGRIAVLAAASNTRATFYNKSSKSVDFFTFFLLQGLGYNEKESWWNKNAAGDKGSYPGYFSADLNGNGDGAATLGEFYSFASNCIDANIPGYMKKSWYWGDKSKVQKTRFYAGNLKNLVIYQPK